MEFTGPIFTKFTFTQQIFMNVFCAEFFPKNKDAEKRNSLFRP